MSEDGEKIIGLIEEITRRQKARGRLGRGTVYREESKTVYSISWRKNREALDKEKNVDGLFPLLCTDRGMGGKEDFFGVQVSAEA